MHNIYGIDKMGSGQRWGTESSYKTNYALLKTQETREGNGNGWKGMEGNGRDEERNAMAVGRNGEESRDRRN